MRIVYGADREICQWVARRMDGAFPADAVALGVVGADGRPRAGVVFHDYSEKLGNIQLSCAADPGRTYWATPRVISGLLAYPFMQLGVRNVYTVTDQRNQRALKLNIGLGFRRAGIIEGFFPEADAVTMRMTRDYYLRNYAISEQKRAA